MLELLLTTYAFCYHFQLDDPLIQLVEDYKWINFFDFRWKLGIDGLSLGPVLLTGFITTLATLAAWPVYSGFSIIPFLDVSNVQWSNRIIFFSGPFTIFHHVGIRINSSLSTSIHVGRKETSLLSHKIYFVHGGGFHFSLNGSSGCRFIWFE
ncbi:putative NADH:ubiquinone oxidoreductase [Helianthus debilis subsp. tardiflorus]